MEASRHQRISGNQVVAALAFLVAVFIPVVTLGIIVSSRID